MSMGLIRLLSIMGQPIVANKCRLAISAFRDVALWTMLKKWFNFLE